MRDRSGARDGKEARPANTHMGVQWEVEVPPELLNGTPTPVLKHMQVGTAPELCGAEKQAGECARRTGPAPWCPAAGGGWVERRRPAPCSPSPGVLSPLKVHFSPIPAAHPQLFQPHRPALRPGCFSGHTLCVRACARAQARTHTRTHARCPGSFFAGRGLV